MTTVAERSHRGIVGLESDGVRPDRQTSEDHAQEKTQGSPPCPRDHHDESTAPLDSVETPSALAPVGDAAIDEQRLSLRLKRAKVTARPPRRRLQAPCEGRHPILFRDSPHGFVHLLGQSY